MEYIEIAKGMGFSRIVQGFWRLTDWNVSAEWVAEFMENCIKRGVTTFDTAEIYGLGECEVQLGAALKVSSIKRADYQIITKTGITNENGFGYYDTRYERIIRSCQRSIEALGCEYIDLYLIHREDPLIDHHEVARALLDLKKQGLIKEIGVSNFDPFKFNALNEATGGQLVTNQIEWNPCCFEHFDSGLIDVLTAGRVRPMIWSPLAGGRLFTSDEPRYKAARKVIEQIAKNYSAKPDTVVFSWLMQHPVGAIPLSGSQKLERLDAAIEALTLKLTHREWYEIYVASGQQVLR
jgi:Predicted oxidoreductase